MFLKFHTCPIFRARVSNDACHLFPPKNSCETILGPQAVGQNACAWLSSHRNFFARYQRHTINRQASEHGRSLIIVRVARARSISPMWGIYSVQRDATKLFWNMHKDNTTGLVLTGFFLRLHRNRHPYHGSHWRRRWKVSLLQSRTSVVTCARSPLLLMCTMSTVWQWHLLLWICNTISGQKCLLSATKVVKPAMMLIHASKSSTCRIYLWWTDAQWCTKKNTGDVPVQSILPRLYPHRRCLQLEKLLFLVWF